MRPWPSFAPQRRHVALCLLLASAPIGCGDDGDDDDGAATTSGPGSGTEVAPTSSGPGPETTTDPDTTAGPPDTTSDTTAGPTTSDGTTTDGTTTDTEGAAAPGGTIIPLYTYPTDPTWLTVATAKQDNPEVGVIAIINPNSGPGMTLDANYDAGITMLQSAGVVVIGYVYTSYAARPAMDVEADISTYASLYPQLDGVMFDEMSNVAGDEAYYASLSTFARGQGLGYTVGNPGTGVPESFVDTVDAMFVYENAGLPDPDGFAGWIDGYDRERFAIIPHSVGGLDPGFVSAALEHVGFIYVTDDMLPNPWDSLPSYFDELMQQLAAG